MRELFENRHRHKSDPHTQGAHGTLQARSGFQRYSFPGSRFGESPGTAFSLENAG
jgi:hypothetical protein